MSGGGRRPRWVVVVQPDQPELFELLRSRLEGSEVEVQRERRQRERRRGNLGPPTERRVTDRRRQRPVALVTPGTGPAAVERSGADPPEPARAPAQESLTGPRCPTCQELLEFELPRFPQPPARLEVVVRHVARASQVAQHFVEIAAFTVSGRIVLSQRVPARLQR